MASSIPSLSLSRLGDEGLWFWVQRFLREREEKRREERNSAVFGLKENEKGFSDFGVLGLFGMN